VDRRTALVLLVGKGLHGASDLTEHLRRRNCECFLAASCEEASRLMDARPFSLVLSESVMPDCAASCLIPLLVRSGASMFLHVAVEDGCWWVPAVREGQPCLGAPALRPREFAEALEQLLRRARGAEPAARTAPASSQAA
jgi:DNA-binding NtrC family response regulator